jgi:hypothetical protein
VSCTRTSPRRRPVRLRAKRSPVPNRSRLCAPRADPISWRAATACSREAPKRCNVCRRIHRASRLRAGAPSRRLPAALLLPEANPVGLQAARLGPRRNRWRAPHPQRGRRLRRGRAGRECIRRQAHRHRDLLREKRNSQVPSRSAPFVPRAEAISGRIVAAFSREVPRRCNVSSGVRRSSRLRAGVPSRRSAAAHLRLEENPRAREAHRLRELDRQVPRRLEPDPRARRRLALRRYLRARRCSSCGPAVRIVTDFVATFPPAEAASSCASRKTPRTCRPAVPARSPPHAASVESVFSRPAIPAIAHVPIIAGGVTLANTTTPLRCLKSTICTSRS